MGSSDATIVCEDAELQSDLKAGVLKVICHNSTVTVGNLTFSIPGISERVIPLNEASKGGVKSASELPMSKVPEEVKRSQDRIEELQQKFAFRAAEQMATGDLAGLTDPGWATDERQISDERVRMFHLQIEPTRRWANGFSCLFFVLLGRRPGS